MFQCFKSQTSNSLKHVRALVWPPLIRRLGLPGVDPAMPRIARSGCLEHVYNAAMLIAWMEKIEKTQTKHPLREARTITVAACDKNISCIVSSFAVRSILRGRGRGRSSFRIPWFTSMFRCSHVLCCMFVLSLLLCYIAFVYKGQAATASPSPFSTCIPFFVCSLFIVTLTCLTSTMAFVVRFLFNVTPLSLYILNEYE